MQIQIFEYVGHRVPKSAVKCRLLRRNLGMVPLRGQESRKKFQTTPSIDRRISHTVQSDLRHIRTGGSGIWQFRKFFVSLI